MDIIAQLFELQYRFSKFTRNIFKKRAKHIDFLELGHYNINTHNANIACRKLVTGWAGTISSTKSLMPSEKLQRNRILFLQDSKTKIYILFLSKAISSVWKKGITSWLLGTSPKRSLSFRNWWRTGSSALNQLRSTVVLNDGGKGAQFRRNGCSIWAVEVRNLARNTQIIARNQRALSEHSPDSAQISTVLKIGQSCRDSPPLFPPFFYANHVSALFQPEQLAYLSQILWISGSHNPQVQSLNRIAQTD